MPSAKVRRWSGGWPGEFTGSIWASKSIDLERSLSKVAIAESLTAKANSTDLTNLTAPVAFIRTAADSTDRYWSLSQTGRLHKTTNTDPETGWAQDAIANTPTAGKWDMIEFSGALLVAIDAGISRLSAGTWTAAWWTSTLGLTALTASVPHRFAILAGALLITNGRYTATYDGTIGTHQDLVLPSQFQQQFIMATQDLAYIGTKSLNGGEAEMFAWDRANTNYSGRWKVGDSECLAGFVVGGIPFIITKKGMILRFTGQGFTPFQQFPTVELKKTINNIDPNGISVDNNIVKILVDFGVIADPRVRSGIWTLEIDTRNLYHSGSVKNNVAKDYSQQEIATAGALLLTLPTQGRYLVGAQAYTAYSGTTMHGIFTLDEASTSNRGYFITPKIKAGNVRRFWREIFTRFNNFQNSTDRVRAAYRTSDSTTLPAFETITWVNATSFTGSNANAAIGDFVEIIAGDNAGLLAKITNKTGSGTFTFTIDVSGSASTSTARAMYMKFTDMGTISSQAQQEQVFRPLARSNWIQYLIELRGDEASPQLEDIILDGGDVPF